MADAPGVGDTHTARGARGLLAYLAGMVGVSVGAGVGVMSLRTPDDVPVAVAGLLCLASGLVLLVGGSVVVVRSARAAWRRALAALAAITVAVAVVLPTAQAFAVVNVPRPAPGPQTPADRGLAYLDVTFRTPDGARLSGWYLPARNGAAVALLHGASSTRSAVLPQAAVLARHGYGVLLYDARGHGRSTGRAMELGWAGDADLAGAVTYLQGRPEVDRSRIGAVGMSMGAEQAVGAAAADRRIRAVVAEGATGRVAADHEWLSDRYGLRGAVTEMWNGVLLFGLADLLTSLHPPISLHDAVRRAAPRPVLLVTGGQVPAEQNAAAYVRSASPSTVQVWRVPGAAHTGGLATSPRRWEARVVDFLDRNLSP